MPFTTFTKCGSIKFLMMCIQSGMMSQTMLNSWSRERADTLLTPDALRG